MNNQGATFDVQSFMSAQVDGVLDTKLIPHPTGEFTGQISTDDKGVDIMTGTDKNGKPYARCIVIIKTDDPSGQLFAAMGRTPSARYDFMLDTTETGGLDMSKGRNIRLGALREAVGQNRPGPWSFMMLKGQQLKFKVEHEPRKDDPSTIDARVTRIAAFSA